MKIKIIVAALLAACVAIVPASAQTAPLNLFTSGTGKGQPQNFPDFWNQNSAAIQAIAGSGLSGLTAGRIPFASSATTVIDNGNLTFTTTTSMSTLNVGNATAGSNGTIIVGGSGTGVGYITGGGGALNFTGGPMELDTTGAASTITIQTENVTRAVVTGTGWNNMNIISGTLAGTTQQTGLFVNSGTISSGVIGGGGDSTFRYANNAAMTDIDGIIYHRNNTRLADFDGGLYSNLASGSILMSAGSNSPTVPATANAVAALLGIGVQTVVPSSGTAAISWPNGNSVLLTVTSATTVVASSNAVPGMIYSISVNSGTLNNPVLVCPVGWTQGLSGTSISPAASNTCVLSGTGVPSVDVLTILVNTATTARIKDISPLHAP